MSMRKGTVEYLDVILAVTDISLRDGAFLVVAVGPGPLDEYHGPVRLYGPDGLLVQDGGHADCPSVKRSGQLRLELALTPGSPEAA